MITIETHVNDKALEFIPEFTRLSEVCLAGWPFFVKKKTPEQFEKTVDAIKHRLDSLHAVVVKDGDKLVGGTYGHTIFPRMGDISKNIGKFHDLNRVYWIAGTMLLPEYQGQGISHKIYNTRDPWIIASGKYDAIAHFIIKRPDNHPLKPKDHVPYGKMWEKRGYRYLEGMDVKLSYEDALDQPGHPGEKIMELWLKDLKNG